VTPKPSLEFEALGTSWFIARERGISLSLEQRVHSELKDIDRVWSRFRKDSLVTKMAHEKGNYLLDAADLSLLQWYEALYLATNGLVSPLIGHTISDAGYDASYRLSPREHITKTPPWDEIIAISSEGLTIKAPWLLDVGAAGKGFAVDTIAKLLGDGSYIIDAGGDILAHGPPRSIGLEDPRDSKKLIGTVTIANESICGSAVNRRAWGEWHHIINPDTSLPAEDVIATWVIAESAMKADGIATALFFVSPETLKSLGAFSYIIMYANGKVYHTNNNAVTLFTS